MAYSAIDIGDRIDTGGTTTGSYTYIAGNNKANQTGLLTSFETFFATTGSGCIIGTLVEAPAATFTARDHIHFNGDGSVTAGSRQTYTGDNCDVNSGDVIGIYFVNGSFYYDSTADTYSRFYQSGDRLTTGAIGFYEAAGHSSVYATGMTIPDAPTSVSATDNLTDKVTVTWTAGTGETDGHRVYRDTVDISGVVAHGTATYDDTTAVAGTTYSYTVKAINAAGLSAASTADNGTRVAAGGVYIPQVIIIQ